MPACRRSNPPTYPRYPCHPQAEWPRFRLARLGWPSQYRTSRSGTDRPQGRKVRKRGHRGRGRRSSDRRQPARWKDHRGRSVRRKPIPLSSKALRNRRLRPKEPQTDNWQVRLTAIRREPTEVARPRPEPRTPEELAPEAFDPPRKDAKPSPARQFGPGTSGGRWRHRLPFCFWGQAQSCRHRIRFAPRRRDAEIPRFKRRSG